MSSKSLRVFTARIRLDYLSTVFLCYFGFLRLFIHMMTIEILRISVEKSIFDNIISLIILLKLRFVVKRAQGTYKYIFFKNRSGF